MSGGYFKYKQYELSILIDDIKRLIQKSNNKDEYHTYSEETINKFKEAIKVLKQAEEMIHRIDWLASEDDGEETFHQYWDTNLQRIENENQTM